MPEEKLALLAMVEAQEQCAINQILAILNTETLSPTAKFKTFSAIAGEGCLSALQAQLEGTEHLNIHITLRTYNSLTVLLLKKMSRRADFFASKVKNSWGSPVDSKESDPFMGIEKDNNRLWVELQVRIRPAITTDLSKDAFPFHRALVYGTSATVELLLNTGTDVNENGKYIYHTEAELRHNRVAHDFLFDNAAYLPLVCTIIRREPGAAEITRRLLARGAYLEPLNMGSILFARADDPDPLLRNPEITETLSLIAAKACQAQPIGLTATALRLAQFLTAPFSSPTPVIFDSSLPAPFESFITRLEAAFETILSRGQREIDIPQKEVDKLFLFLANLGVRLPSIACEPSRYRRLNLETQLTITTAEAFSRRSAAVRAWKCEWQQREEDSAWMAAKAKRA
ncbi:MAG: hypothetical protein Q7V63_05395 [Gammaproteobacteria bacterium]|nr:hypothetical protein [Gammaproteobacteria bacterium]